MAQEKWNLKDAHDAHMRHAEFAAQRHDKRRDIEWRVSVGIWAIAAAGLTIEKLDASLKPLITISVATFAILVLIWQVFLARLHEKDKDRQWHHARLANGLLISPFEGGDLSPKQDPKRITRKFWTYYPHAFQVVIAWTLLFATWYKLYSS